MTTTTTSASRTTASDLVAVDGGRRSLAGARWMAVLRLATGFIFLWAFLDKLFGLGYSTKSANAWIHGGSPTNGFLSHVAVGPFMTPIVPAVIAGNLNIGAVSRTIDMGGDQLPDSLSNCSSPPISAAAAGSSKSGNGGTILFSGNNTYTGDTYRGGGNFAAGSDTAFGTGRVFFAGGNLLPTAASGRWPTILLRQCPDQFPGRQPGHGRHSTAAAATTSPSRATSTAPAAPSPSTSSVAGVLEFAGGIGETFAARA